MTSLPEELSSLRNLKELVAFSNDFRVLPISVLTRLTALTFIDLGIQFGECRAPVKILLQIPSSLLPILHPGLVKLDLQQRLQWDSISLVHLGRALAAAAARDPPLTILF
jgi:hypothetical protein